MHQHLMSRGCYYWKAGRVDSLGSLAPGSHNLTPTIFLTLNHFEREQRAVIVIIVEIFT